jgi:hypothetical protein
MQQTLRLKKGLKVLVNTLNVIAKGAENKTALGALKNLALARVPKSKIAYSLLYAARAQVSAQAIKLI